MGIGSFTIDRQLDIDASVVSLDDSAAGSVLVGRASPWTGVATVTYEYDLPVLAAPAPGAASLLLLGVSGLLAVRRRKTN